MLSLQDTALWLGLGKKVTRLHFILFFSIFEIDSRNLAVELLFDLFNACDLAGLRWLHKKLSKPDQFE